MLRTPASLSVDSIRYFQLDHWATVLAFLAVFSAFLFASFLSYRRLNLAKQIAAIWANRKSGASGRTENEILHAVNQMLFPIRMLMGALLVLLFLAIPLIKNAYFEVFASTVVAFLFFYYCVQIQREQKLLFSIRKLDPKKAKVNSLTVRTFLGVGLAILGSFGLASLVTAVRETLLPIDGTMGSVFHFCEFLALLIFFQMLIAPLVIRLMLPSRPPTTEGEVRTAAIVTDAFTKLGLKAPRVRILNLDGIRNYNALIAGANRAPGPFRQLVMISQSEELNFSEGETRAIIHHELAHSFLMHIPVRLTSSMLLWAMGLVPVFVASIFFENPLSMVAFPLLSVAYFFTIHPLLLGRLVREQEIQADEFAVMRLGSMASDLVSALTKATVASGALVDRKPPGAWMNANAAHPTVLEREAILQRLEISKAIPKHSRLEPKSDLSMSRAIRHLFTGKLLRTVAALNVASGAFLIVLFSTDGPKISASRGPASIEEALKTVPSRSSINGERIRKESLNSISQ